MKKPRALARCCLLLLGLISIPGPSPVSSAAPMAFAIEPPVTYTLSLQYMAMTPNAGGQTAYGLRFAKDDRWEIGAFSNQYLLTGQLPLSGVTYGWRFPLCAFPCVVRSFVQLGAGLSTAGPMLELLWNLTPLWIIRIDIATHAYFSTMRPIIWSYPLWLGLSVPF